MPCLVPGKPKKWLIQVYLRISADHVFDKHLPEHFDKFCDKNMKFSPNNGVLNGVAVVEISSKSDSMFYE